MFYTFFRVKILPRIENRINLGVTLWQRDFFFKNSFCLHAHVHIHTHQINNYKKKKNKTKERGLYLLKRTSLSGMSKSR